MKVYLQFSLRRSLRKERDSIKCINCFRLTDRINRCETRETATDLLICFSLAFSKGTPEVHSFFLPKGFFMTAGFSTLLLAGFFEESTQNGCRLFTSLRSVWNGYSTPVFDSAPTLTTTRLSLFQPSPHSKRLLLI